MWLSELPKSLIEKNNIEVRGELYCDEESFFLLSNEMESLGLDKPTSQRNIVAGLMGRKDNLELCRYIKFMAFDYISEERLKKEEEKFEKLQKNGFVIPDFEIHKNIENVSDVIKKASEFMSEGHYQIDGLVFTINNLSLHEELGETSHHPRYKMAFKFHGESKPAILKDISWSVSRNGILTPVGEIEPVELSGAMISRVTLHNYGLVCAHQLKKGDKIEIIRSGEVIPKFLSVLESSDSIFEIPKHCQVVIQKLRL
jgi:DNA ligase (NAD+)